MKKRSWIILIIIMAVILAVTVLSVVLYYRANAKAEYLQICKFDFNTKQNGFNQMKQDAYNFDLAEFSYSETGGIDGSGCIVINLPTENDARFTYEYSDAKKDSYYRMSVWVKTENVGEIQTANTDVGANLSVLNTYNRSEEYRGDTDWTYIEYYGKTAEDQSGFTVCLRLGFYGGVTTGTVYFDDFELEQLETLPEGAIAYSMENIMNKIQPSALHRDTMLIATVLLIFTCAFFIVVYRYIKKSESEAQQLKIKGIAANVVKATGLYNVLLLICVGFGLRIIMSFTMPQCDIDVNLFQYWANNLADKGITNIYAYAESINLDYPPLFLYYLNFMGHIGRIFDVTQSLFYDVLLKLPAIIADCVIAFVIYLIANKRMSRKWTTFIVAMWLFNPMVILDSACWGQVDSILALALLLSAYCIEKDQYVLSAVALAFAITLKPQGIFFVPILGFALLRQLIWDKEVPMAKRLLRFAYSIVGFVVTTFLIVLPFGIKMEPNIISWIIGVYTDTAGGYTYATVNSFNFFYLMGANWVNDSEAFFGLTYFAWGMIAIVLASLLTGVLYIKAEKKKTYVYLLASMLIYVVTTFAPRMHERYFFPALVLLLVAVIYSNNKLVMIIYGVMTISNFYTVLEVMTGLSIGSALRDTDSTTAAYYNWPPLNTYRAIMGVFNVICAVAIIAVSCYMILTKDRHKEILRIWEDLDEE